MGRLQRQFLTALRSQLAGGAIRPPEGGAVLWNAFSQLSQQRSWHAHGPNPISFSDIAAYCRMMCLPLEARHIEIITAMDRVWLASTMGKVTTPDKRSAQVSKHPLTVSLFDAILG